MDVKCGSVMNDVAMTETSKLIMLKQLQLVQQGAGLFNVCGGLTVGICGFCRASRCVFPMYESIFSTNMVTTPSAVMITTYGSATEQCTMGEPRSTGMKWSCVTESRIERKHDDLCLLSVCVN